MAQHLTAPTRGALQTPHAALGGLQGTLRLHQQHNQLLVRHQQHAAPQWPPRRDAACRIVARAAAQEAAPAAAADAAKGRSGSSGIGSGIKLENVAITFKNQQVLRDISWDVKKGERVGLVGVNGAGKTTQLQALVRALQAPNFNEFADKVLSVVAPEAPPT